ncbi:conserved hypothetical protein [delta proteobacterium NaphS2]|nr:conserved hypothetical protein [delta proteobacterium NaphS2]
MSAKVFISCGQASDEERIFAQSLGEWLRSEGYVPYVAIEVQSILDLNYGIIGELKTSDYYIFVNFKREEVHRGTERFRRGSLYTHQELAVAYAIGFERMLLLNQKGAFPEGMQSFMVSNVPEFSEPAEALELIRAAIGKAGWRPEYSRHLSLASLDLGPEITYYDHASPPRRARVLLATIRNGRSDIGAMQAVARLSSLVGADGTRRESPDRSHLKATGHSGYSQAILPQSTAVFDLLTIDLNSPSQLYLNSSHDVVPRAPVIDKPGNYELLYEVYSSGFPVLRLRVDIEHTGNPKTLRARCEGTTNKVRL